MLEHEQLDSEPSRLDLWVATTTERRALDHVLLLVHGIPRAYGMARQAAGLLPEFAELIARESGWMVATATMSGIGASTGTFSVSQWRLDLASMIARFHDDESWIALAGFGIGGALALEAAAVDDRVRGVATFATPSHLDRWLGEPLEMHRLAERAGVIDPRIPLLGPDELAKDICALEPLHSAAAVPPKRFLIGHGSDDPEVPVSDARELHDAAEGRAELRVIQGAGHALRADPRMVATLLGWLDRHR